MSFLIMALLITSPVEAVDLPLMAHSLRLPWMCERCRTAYPFGGTCEDYWPFWEDYSWLVFVTVATVMGFLAAAFLQALASLGLRFRAGKFVMEKPLQLWEAGGVMNDVMEIRVTNAANPISMWLNRLDFSGTMYRIDPDESEKLSWKNIFKRKTYTILLSHGGQCSSLFRTASQLMRRSK